MCDHIMLFESREAAENRAILVPEDWDVHATMIAIDDYGNVHDESGGDVLDWSATYGWAVACNYPGMMVPMYYLRVDGSIR